MSFISHKQFDFDFELITHLRHKQYKEPHPVFTDNKAGTQKVEGFKDKLQENGQSRLPGKCLFIKLHGFS